MIRLTRANGQVLYVNPEHLIEVGYDDKQTLVSTLAEGWYVLESPEEVARKVLEWKLAMERYRADIFAIAKETGEKAKMLAWALRIMQNLAGLEEPNHDAG